MQQGLELADLRDESSNKLEDNNMYKSDPSRQRPKGCLQLVQQIVDKFIVRGSYRLM
jgi:hypothetical protein